uniref:Uncharacterized protein n=1 Tax=Anopheles minimus TaxID=112268 RepID=A0A182WP78_9DIPT
MHATRHVCDSRRLDHKYSTILSQDRAAWCVLGCWKNRFNLLNLRTVVNCGCSRVSSTCSCTSTSLLRVHRPPCIDEFFINQFAFRARRNFLHWGNCVQARTSKRNETWNDLASRMIKKQFICRVAVCRKNELGTQARIRMLALGTAGIEPRLKVALKYAQVFSKLKIENTVQNTQTSYALFNEMMQFPLSSGNSTS